MEASSPKQQRRRKAETKKVAAAYFAAINAHDVDAAIACWARGGVERIHGQRELTAPDGCRAFLEELFAALPDVRFDILDTTIEADRCSVRSVLRGTFAGPGHWVGFAPNGARIELPVVDHLVVRDGLIEEIDAYLDGMTTGRQLGVLPAQDSPAELRLARAVNLRTRLGARLHRAQLGQVAEGVWRLQGHPGRSNVFFLRDGDGVLMFDAGTRMMTTAVAKAAAHLGGLTRIVLGHADHRGAASAFDVPVLCHPDEVDDAEGSGARDYWDLDRLGWRRPIRELLHERLVDGGPVTIAETVTDGDDVAGFRVVALPGHAPGLIALYREDDRLALVSDCIYTSDRWGRPGAARVPPDPYNVDTEQARASIRALAALEPAAAWPGHAGGVVGIDVRARLERAAETPA